MPSHESDSERRDSERLIGYIHPPATERAAPPPIVLRLHIADASVLLVHLISEERYAGSAPEPGSGPARLKTVREELKAAMLRWPTP